MSGGYLMPDGSLVIDENHETSPAAVSETSPCGQAIKQKEISGILEVKIDLTNGIPKVS